MTRPNALVFDVVFVNGSSVRSSAATCRVLGIDPGLTRCGYAVVDGRGAGRVAAVSLGVITTPRTDALPQRLAALRTEFADLIG
ncbi:MAG: crossover junction endodeoxyribonuclease RuvC, partial [Acidobacteriota bacterium]